MSFNVTVGGVSIPDEKVVAVHGMKEFVSPAVVANKLNMLKSQVVEIRKRLREGLADTIDGKKSAKKQASKPAKAKINDSSLRGEAFVEEKVLIVLAKSSKRLLPREVIVEVTPEHFTDEAKILRRQTVKTMLQNLLLEGLVERKSPGSYSVTQAGLKRVISQCTPHVNAKERALKHLKEARIPDDAICEHDEGEVISLGEPRKQRYEPECDRFVVWSMEGQVPGHLCSASIVNENIPGAENEKGYKIPFNPAPQHDTEKPTVQSELHKIDQVFQKRALDNLENQVALLDKLHSLTGALADEMRGSVNELKRFME